MLIDEKIDDNFCLKKMPPSAVRYLITYIKSGN